MEGPINTRDLLSLTIDRLTVRVRTESRDHSTEVTRLVKSEYLDHSPKPSDRNFNYSTRTKEIHWGDRLQTLVFHLSYQTKEHSRSRRSYLQRPLPRLWRDGKRGVGSGSPGCLTTPVPSHVTGRTFPVSAPVTTKVSEGPRDSIEVVYPEQGDSGLLVLDGLRTSSDSVSPTGNNPSGRKVVGENLLSFQSQLDSTSNTFTLVHTTSRMIENTLNKPKPFLQTTLKVVRTSLGTLKSRRF